MDDPSVKGLSRSTANTHIINHRNYLLALKEDSPPSALDLLTLETVAPTYTFDGQLPSQTFTAHPKLDSHTGNMVAFGYEAEGHGSDVVTMFEFTPQGRKVWDAKIQVPYVGMLHDFAVTENYIVFYVIPMAIDQAQMDARRHPLVVGRHEADVLRLRAPRRRRQGRAVDRRPDAQRDARHGRVRRRRQAHRRRRDVDVESVPVHADARRLALGSGRGLEPHHAAHGRSVEAPAVGVRHRADVSARRRAAAPGRPLQHGAVPLRLPGLPGSRTRRRAPAARAMRASITRTAPRRCSTPAPRRRSPSAASRRRARPRPKAPGYLMGLATRNTEGGRSDLVILDAERLADGPVATVHLPMRAPGQVHGWWVPEWQMPTALSSRALVPSLVS